MAHQKSIFDQPFASDESLSPSKEQLSAFLASASKEKGKDLEGSDLMFYRQLLNDVSALESNRSPSDERENLQNHVFYGVMRYSRFAHPHLLSVVELYKYQMHMLNDLDFESPTSFVRAAEKTISKLNKNKLDHVLRILRLQEMIREREKIITGLTQASSKLVKELCNIVKYLKENFHKIEKRCEASLIMLSDLAITEKKENELLDDIKARPEKALRAGKITLRELEKATQEVNVIADELSTAIRVDINALTGLYEAMHEHLVKAERLFDSVLEDMKSKKNITEQERLLSKAEHTLIVLLSAFHPDQNPVDVTVLSAHEKFITRKRKEMLDYLFEVAQKDRRKQPERRAKTRRTAGGAGYKGPKRRSGLDRRSGKSRRYQ